MADQFTLDNIDGLLNKMKQVDYEVRKKGGRFALRKAAQVVRDAARANAARLDDPSTSEVIAKNIDERWSDRYNKATGDLKFRVGVLGGVFGKLGGDETGVYGDKFTKKTRKRGAISSGPGGDTRHWGYLEFGTEKAAATPFLRPAMESNIPAVTSAFMTHLDAAIDRAVKRNGKPS